MEGMCCELDALWERARAGKILPNRWGDVVPHPEARFDLRAGSRKNLQEEKTMNKTELIAAAGWRPACPRRH